MVVAAAASSMPISLVTGETCSARGRTWTGRAESLIRVAAIREAEGCACGAGCGEASACEIEEGGCEDDSG